MKSSTRNIQPVKSTYRERSPVQITLYELVDAISTEVEVGEENMIAETVNHLINSGKIKFIGSLKHLKVIC